ncbi:MAG: tetratricopeptide repeat protein [Muribaculaceae bacterium]|nr:tetratricopeptide repeat protein [Muribaculaceae bacterium]
MKHIIITLLTVAASLLHATAQPDTTAIAETPVSQPDATTALEQTRGDLAHRADSAYSQDNFVLAEQLYLESISRDGSAATIIYNLGNAYYRQGNLGKAIVNYERALKLDPTNSDARDNLEFVKAKITDRQIDEGSIMTTLWNNIVNTFKADTWAWIAVILFALFLAGAFTYMLSSVVAIRKLSFFGGIIVFILCAAAIIISFAAANRITDNNYAIILPPSAQLSTTPREARTQAEEAFLLHEGTKVEIVDSISTAADGKWYEVKVGGRERAWIKASETERI